MKTQWFLCAIWRAVQIEGQGKQRSPRAHHFARRRSLPGERLDAGVGVPVRSRDVGLGQPGAAARPCDQTATLSRIQCAVSMIDLALRREPDASVHASVRLCSGFHGGSNAAVRA